MATRKKAATKPRGAISVIETGAVPIMDLKTFKGNPRVGNIDKIAQSLKQFGQYRPILVNKGTHTKRPNEILAGNHTYLAMRKNGEDEILVSFVDVDDKTAKAMVLADNKLTELGTFDDEALGRLLADLDVELIDATGFSEAEVDELTGLIAAQAQSVLDSIENAEIDSSGEGFGAVDTEASMGAYESDLPDTTDAFKAADETLKGVIQLDDDMDLDDDQLIQPWGFPKFRTDRLMLVSEIPDNLRTWGGSASKDADHNTEDQWWLYNFGIDSTSGMKDVSKVIVSFYAFDEYFENWWHTPSRFVTKCLNSGIKYIVSPDYSMWPDRPRAEWLWSAYRNRWLGRYFQEAGLKVIPDLTWPGTDLDFLKNIVLPGIPKNTPVIAMQLQTYDPSHADAKKVTDAIKIIYDTIQPNTLLLYCVESTAKHVEDLGLPWNIRRLDTRMALLSEHQKGRTRKSTL